MQCAEAKSGPGEMQNAAVSERGLCQRRYNKQVLKAYPYPFTCTALQFAVGSVLALTMWTLNLHEKPKVDKDLVSTAPTTYHSWHVGIQCHLVQ